MRDTGLVRVLVVDDDEAVRSALTHALHRDGYEVSTAGDGAAALAALLRLRHDAVVLDVLMPEPGGLEVCRVIRARGDDTPILMLTARDLVSDRVAGLDAGADDYLAKPFALEELRARLRALLRRSGAGAGLLRFADVELDVTAHQASRRGMRLPLTKTEFALLELFLRNPGRVLSRTQIFESVWGYDFGPESNGLWVYIGYLRRKLGEPRLIQTVRGIGYVLREEAMSLRARVAIAVGAVVFGALVIVAAVVYPAVGANLRGQDDASLVQVAANAQAVAVKLKQAHTVGQLVPFGSTQLQILPDVTVGPTSGFVDVTSHDVQVADGTAKPYFRDEAYGKVVYRIYAMQLPGQPGVLVRVARPESEATSTQASLGWLLAALVPVSAIAAAVLARLAAGRVLRPVGRLTETVERIRATGDLSAPIETPGHDEISRLGQAFAAMTAALDESAGAQRRLVADASHELRTPLTSLITNLELLAEQPDDPSAPALAAAALAEAGELRGLVNDLVRARAGRAGLVPHRRCPAGSGRGTSRGAGGRPGAGTAVRTRLPADAGPRRSGRAGTGDRQPGRQRAEMEPARWPHPHRGRRREGRGQRRRAGNYRGRPAVHFRSLLPVGPGAGTAGLRPRPRDRAPDRRHAPRHGRSDSAAARGEIPYPRAGGRRRPARGTVATGQDRCASSTAAFSGSPSRPAGRGG